MWPVDGVVGENGAFYFRYDVAAKRMIRIYAQDDAELEAIKAKAGNKKLEIGRFKGLGEMTAPQLKETTMNPAKRKLLKVTIADAEHAADLVERLMGKKPEHRLAFIQANSQQIGAEKLDV